MLQTCNVYAANLSLLNSVSFCGLGRRPELLGLRPYSSIRPGREQGEGETDIGIGTRITSLQVWSRLMHNFSTRRIEKWPGSSSVMWTVTYGRLSTSVISPQLYLIEDSARLGATVYSADGINHLYSTVRYNSNNYQQLSEGNGAQVNLDHLSGVDYTHGLNMEVDLQSLFGLHVTWCAQLYCGGSVIWMKYAWMV